jgi:hypothetical protein
LIQDEDFASAGATTSRATTLGVSLGWSSFTVAFTSNPLLAIHHEPFGDDLDDLENDWESGDAWSLYSVPFRANAVNTMRAPLEDPWDYDEFPDDDLWWEEELGVGPTYINPILSYALDIDWDEFDEDEWQLPIDDTDDIVGPDNNPLVAPQTDWDFDEQVDENLVDDQMPLQLIAATSQGMDWDWEEEAEDESRLISQTDDDDDATEALPAKSPYDQDWDWDDFVDDDFNGWSVDDYALLQFPVYWRASDSISVSGGANTLTLTVNQGDVILLVVPQSDTTDPAPSDAQGAYTLINGPTVDLVYHTWLYALPNANAGVHTISFTGGSGGGSAFWAVYGGAAVAPFDGNGAAAYVSSNTSFSTSYSTTKANDTVVSFTLGLNLPDNLTGQSGIARPLPSTAAISTAHIQDQLAVSAGSQTASFNWTSAQYGFITSVALTPLSNAPFNNQENWDWEEQIDDEWLIDDYSPVAAASVPSRPPEDAWDWDEFADDELWLDETSQVYAQPVDDLWWEDDVDDDWTEEQQPVGPNVNPFLCVEDGWAHFEEECDDEWQEEQQPRVPDNNPVIAVEDPWDWDEQPASDLVFTTYQNIDVLLPQPVEDAWDWDESCDDEWFSEDVPLAPPPAAMPAEDPFFEDDADDEWQEEQAPVGPANLVPVEDPFYEDDSDDEWQEESQPVGPNAPLAIEDPWWIDEFAEDDWYEEVSPIPDNNPALCLEDPWDWEDLTEDDWWVDENPGATVALTITTEDPWDWEDLTEDDWWVDENPGATVALTITTEDPWDWEDLTEDDWWVDENFLPFQSTVLNVEDAWDWDEFCEDDWQEDTQPCVPDVIPPPAPPAGVDATLLRPSRKNIQFKWGVDRDPEVTEAEKPKAKPAKVQPQAAKPSKLLLGLMGQAGIGVVPPPRAGAPVPKVTPIAAPAAVPAPGKPWPEPPAPPADPEKVRLEAERAAAELSAAAAQQEADAARAEAARLAGEIERVKARMAEIERQMEAELDIAKAAAAAHERRARAAEDETTRQMAKRVEEQRKAEDYLRRARNNLIAIQMAIQTFFSDDENG